MRIEEINLTADQQKWLLWFHARQGTGYLDRYGRLVAGGELANSGAQICWLNLVSKGLIAGDWNRIEMTSNGVELARALAP